MAERFDGLRYTGGDPRVERDFIMLVLRDESVVRVLLMFLDDRMLRYLTTRTEEREALLPTLPNYDREKYRQYQQRQQQPPLAARPPPLVAKQLKDRNSLIPPMRKYDRRFALVQVCQYMKKYDDLNLIHLRKAIATAIWKVLAYDRMRCLEDMAADAAA